MIDERRTAGLIVRLGEDPAERGRDAERREVAGRHRRAAQPLGLVDAGQVRRPAADGGQVLEHAAALLPFDEESRRRPVALRAAARAHVLPHHHEALGVLVG